MYGNRASFMLALALQAKTRRVDQDCKQERASKFGL